MKQENIITFEEYINLPIIKSADKKACRYEVFAALTTYILQRENINLIKDIHHPAEALNLANKCADDKNFVKERPNLHDDCLHCLDLYVRYLQEMQKIRKNQNEY